MLIISDAKISWPFRHHKPLELNVPGGGGGGGNWVNVFWVCAAGLSEPLPHYSLFFWPIIDPTLVTFSKMWFSRSQLSHFLSMHQLYQCGFKRRNAVNASLLLILINNNFLNFFNRESSHFESLLTPKSENLRPHSSNSFKNATPL